MRTYFNRAIEKVYTIHIVKESKGIRYRSAVVRNGKPVDLISNKIIYSRDITEKIVEAASKGTHVRIVVIVGLEESIQLVIQTLIKIDS
jgi:hypothetical protein